MNQTERLAYLKFEEENFIPFHQSLAVLESACEGGSLLLITHYEQGELVAIMPYFTKKKLTYTYITHPPMIKWMGPILSNNCIDKREAIAQLLSKVPKVAYFEQNFSYEISKEDLPIEWQADYNKQFSYRIEGIRDLEKVFKGVYADYRNNKIKKAREILTISHEGTIDEFITVHHQSFSRQGIAFPVSKQALKRHIENLLEKKKATLMFARDKEFNTHSVALLAWDTQTAYLHMAGDDVNLRKSGSGIFTTWEAIRFASEKLGLNIFDFEGSMLTNVERVRKRFGAERKYYGKIKRYNSQSFKLLQTLKK